MRYLKHINPKSDTIKHKDYFYEWYEKDKTCGKKGSDQQLNKKRILRENLIINFQLGAMDAVFSPALFFSEDNKWQYAYK